MLAQHTELVRHTSRAYTSIDMHWTRQTVCCLYTFQNVSLGSSQKSSSSSKKMKFFLLHFHLWYWQRCAATFYMVSLSSFVCGFSIRLSVSSSFCGVQCSRTFMLGFIRYSFRERFLFMANGSAYKPSTNKCVYAFKSYQTNDSIVHRPGWIA